MSIVILGTHGQHNHGDELLLESFLVSFSQLGEKMYINSYEPEETREQFKRFNIEVFHTRNEKIKFLWYILKSKAIIFAGGSVIKELNPAYGGDRYGTLNIINMIMQVAHILRKPVFFANIGIGPLETPKGKEIAVRILKRAALIGARDIESIKYAKELNLESIIQHIPDAAYSLDKEYFTLEQREEKSNTERIQIAVNITRNIANPSNWEYFYEQLVKDLVEIKRFYPEVKFIGLPMQEHESANDYKLLETLKKDLDKYNISFDVPRLTDIMDVANVVASSKIVIAEKLHAIILSSILNTPFVGLEYDVKVKGVCTDIKMSDYCVDICQKFPKRAIFNATKKVLGNHSEVRALLSKASMHNQNQATRFLEEIKRGLS